MSPISSSSGVVKKVMLRRVVEERVAEAALVHQESREARALRLDGAGQTGGAGADDQQVNDGFRGAVTSLMPLILTEGVDCNRSET